MHTVILERSPEHIRQLSGSQPLAQQRRRVYIFLTRYGIAYALTLLIMLVGAINYSNSLAYALTFLLAGVFLVAMLSTYGNLRGLVLRHGPAHAVYAGKWAALDLEFDNRFGPERIAMQLQLMEAPRRWRKARLRQDSRPAMISLPAGKISRATLEVLTSKRGYFAPGRLQIASTWPLGLFRAWSYVPQLERSIVYPKPAGSHQLPSTTSADHREELSGKDPWQGRLRRFPCLSAWRFISHHRLESLRQGTGCAGEVLSGRRQCPASY